MRQQLLCLTGIREQGLAAGDGDCMGGSQTDQSGKPVQCAHCNEPMDSPLHCTGCGALNPLPPSLFTYYELFGIPQQYEVDTAGLRRKYLSLSRSIHPDVAGQASEKVHRQSLELSSGLNRAYETLRDPVARAEYLLQLSAGPSAGDDKSVQGQLLGEVMMLREEIDDATRAGDSGSLRSLRHDLLRRHEQSLGEIAVLCRDENLADAAVSKQLRQRLNAIKYWVNLLDKIPTQTEE